MKPTESNTKSKNITTSYIFKENILSSTEICDIVKVCGESGVQHFKFFELDITFASKQSNEKDSATHSPGQVLESTRIDEDVKLIARDELNVKEQEISELILTDPYRYEQLMIQQDLRMDSDA